MKIKAWRSIAWGGLWLFQRVYYVGQEPTWAYIVGMIALMVDLLEVYFWLRDKFLQPSTLPRMILIRQPESSSDSQYISPQSTLQ